MNWARPSWPACGCWSISSSIEQPPRLILRRYHAKITMAVGLFPPASRRRPRRRKRSSAELKRRPTHWSRRCCGRCTSNLHLGQVDPAPPALDGQGIGRPLHAAGTRHQRADGPADQPAIRVHRHPPLAEQVHQRTARPGRDGQRCVHFCDQHHRFSVVVDHGHLAWSSGSLRPSIRQAHRLRKPRLLNIRCSSSAILHPLG